MTSQHAAALADALRINTCIEPLGDRVVPDLSAAYAVQRDLIEVLGEPIAGWKVGATNAKSQQLMGLSGPFYGPMPKRFCVADGGTAALPAGVVGAEIEIAFHLADDLPKVNNDYVIDDMMAAISGVHLAIEVIGLRQIWQGVPEGRHAIADLGANCIFAHTSSPIVGLADKLLNNPASVTARCLVDGVEKGAGDATGVLGNPLQSLLWLANNGPGLLANQWVSTGTVTGLAPISGPCDVVGDFSELGQVRLSISA